ncbi:glycosyltransferase family 4 protein [Polaribacter tangerinus]|uniref:glycosyltransferase family 4 protein n=1 Tax=Polaribacter tangerinus TaxID=1920034 RepID=UPI000B4A9DFE|nr:glycosyltransferase family 4 protein [Polaribacter tangerinus]
MKPTLIHTHFHKRRTGVTRSIENVLPFFDDKFNSYLFGYGAIGNYITKYQLRRILFSNAKVIVHCHRNNEIIRMLIYRAFGAKFTLIATRHAETKPSKLTFKLLKSANKVITLIPSMGKKLGIKNTVIGHGVRVDKFFSKDAVTIEQVSQENIILCAGRVREAKGQLVLLEAAKVLQNNLDWALVIVGKVDKPAFLDQLKAIAIKHKIEKQVYFIKETPEIVSFYQAAKIVVCPSYSEGFSLVTAEAMSCECSVIATKNVGVHSSLIKHKENGYLFEAGNSQQLETILSNKLSGKLPLLGTQARAEIVKNWSAKKEASELINLYLSS